MIPTPLLEIHLVSYGEKRWPKKRLCSQACSHHFKNEIKVFPGRVSTKILSSHVCKLPKSWKLCGGSNTDDNFKFNFLYLGQCDHSFNSEIKQGNRLLQFQWAFQLSFCEKNYGILKALIKLRPKGSKCLFTQNSAYKHMVDKR